VLHATTVYDESRTESNFRAENVLSFYSPGASQALRSLLLMMPPGAASDLPKYEKPPVIEAVCGIQFKPLRKLLVPHFGELWGRYKPKYSKCQEAAPLTPTIERLSEVPGTDIQVAPELLLPRVWFVHQDGNGVIQVQRDRFLHNWRKAKPEDDYPHYESVISLFREHYNTFVEFLTDNELGTIEPLQYEMTYVNHILRGDGWHDPEDFSTVFPDFPWHSNEPWLTEQRRFLSIPNGRNLRVHFDLPNKSGRLHVTIRDGLLVEDQRPLLILELTVRGIGQDKSAEAMQSWFNLAHVWIVRAFADLTGKEIQDNTWRRIR